MPGIIDQWLRKFLGKRGLECPDGRALYAYRCSEQEFSSLAEALRVSGSSGGVGESDTAAIRAFVLYAAEWWQRKYDGRQWSWDPILRSAGWHSVSYPELYKPTARACRWWNIQMVRLLSSGTRYLGTFACQGGLPLGLIGAADSRVARYLRAVLKHTVEYRRFVDDPIELARDQQHLLLPPTMRRDYVFRLAADLIESVIGLQADAEGKDPLSKLDQTRAGWRDQMPLDLGNERARNLLVGLLQDAGEVTTFRVSDFRAERFLRRTGTGYRFGARVRLPASISAQDLAIQLRVSNDALPHRLEVRIPGERVRVLGVYALRGEEDFVFLHDGQPTEIWDEEAAEEIRLTFLSGETIGTSIVPYRGVQLEELPWCFRPDGDEEYIFVGEGRVSNRSPELLALVPDGCTVDEAEGVVDLGEQTLGRPMWRIKQPATVRTDGGFCVIRPGVSQVSDEEYCFVGSKCYDLESSVPLFKGPPRLQIAKPERVSRSVQEDQIDWRQSGSSWCARPTTYGLWEIRHIAADGELRFRGRVGILPDGFTLTPRPGNDLGRGELEVGNAAEVRVALSTTDVDVETDVETVKGEGSAMRVAIAARNPRNPPAKVGLRLQWPNGRELPVRVRFPGGGGRFLSNGEPLTHLVAASELYGVRATAMSPMDFQKFWIEGALQAPDLGNLARVTHFRTQMVKSGLSHELPIIDVRPMIELLLSASSSTEAKVILRIVGGANLEHGEIHVSKFPAILQKEANMPFVSIIPDLEVEDGSLLTCEALPICRPADDPIPLSLVGPSAKPVGIQIPEDMNLCEPWLVVVRYEGQLQVRPIEIGDGQYQLPEVGNEAAIGLASASKILDPSRRAEAIVKALDTMLQMEDEYELEKEWTFLTNTFLRAQGLPAAALSLLPCLVKNPQLLVRCLFRLDSGLRKMLWELESELPFSWLLIRRDIWLEEAESACSQLVHYLNQAGGKNDHAMAYDHICSIIDEGANRHPSLAILAADIAVRLGGGFLSQKCADEIQSKRDTKVNDMLIQHMGNFPGGYGRGDWIDELGHDQILNALWQENQVAFGERQPIFDTPVAAACCCFLGNATPRTSYLTKRIRTDNPEWFDIAYSAAWVQLALAVDRLHRGQQ